MIKTFGKSAIQNNAKEVKQHLCEEGWLRVNNNSSDYLLALHPEFLQDPDFLSYMKKKIEDFKKRD